jgi:hypothetical protein
MMTIDRELLSGVSGGADARTTRTTADVKAFGGEASVTRETRISENESCRQDLKASCNATNRSTFLGMDAGPDRQKAGQCFIDNFPKCPQ